MRTIKAAAWFAFITLVVYLLLFWALSNFRIGSTYAILRSNDFYRELTRTDRLRLLQHDPAKWYDVRVLGSSHAYRGYDPRIFAARGHSSYNLGSSSQTPLNSEVLLKAYVQNNNTGLLVLDLYAPVFGMSGLESTAELLVELPEDRVAWEMAWSTEDIRNVDLLTYRYFGHQPALTAADSAATLSGYIPRTDSLLGTEVPEIDSPAPPLARQTKAFTRILELAQQRGVPIVLVTHYAPSHRDRQAQARFKAMVDSVIAPYPNIRYLDLSFDHQLDDRAHFYDANHLNQAGVDIFNTRLVDTLEALRLLPAQHGHR